jgi:hypothetical protein
LRLVRPSVAVKLGVLTPGIVGSSVGIDRVVR